MLANRTLLKQLLISSKEKEDFLIIACLYFISMFHISVPTQIQNRNQN